MSRTSKIYACFISVIGITLGSYCVYQYFHTVFSYPDPNAELRQFGVLLLLYLLCRCLPIYIRKDYAIDMSFVCNLASVLCKGPVVSAAMVIIATPFVIVPTNSKDRAYDHFFNKPPIKTAFNAGNITISVFLAAVAYQKCGGDIKSISRPQNFIPAVVSITTFFLLNCAILMFLFHLDKQIPFFSALFKNLYQFFPNIVASAPIAYFLVKIMEIKHGEFLVILITLPLLLARYSFVLYLDVKQNFYNMLKTLTAALEAKDKYTEGHSHRVEDYAEMISRKLHCSLAEQDNIKVAALLHDVGKIGIDDEILNKPGPLTPEERKVIMTHPLISESILENVKLNKKVRSAIRHHHERYDGGGYPDGTKGDEIGMEAYIIGVADAFDAMTSDRAYCASMPIEQVTRILQEESGKQFHPRAVSAFLEVLRERGYFQTGGQE